MAETKPRVEQEDKAPKRDDNRQGEFIETLSNNGVIIVVVAVVVLEAVPVGLVFLIPGIVVTAVSTCHIHDRRCIPRFLHAHTYVQRTQKKKMNE